MPTDPDFEKMSLEHTRSFFSENRRVTNLDLSSWKSVTRPKLIYLDQNILISLARIHFGREINTNLQKTLQSLILARDAGKIRILINHTNIGEALKISHTEQREHLLDFMFELSKGWAFRPFIYLRELEVYSYIFRQAKNDPHLNIRNKAVGVGMEYIDVLPKIVSKIPVTKLGEKDLEMANRELAKELNDPKELLDFYKTAGHLPMDPIQEVRYQQNLGAIRERLFKIKDKKVRGKLPFAQDLRQFIKDNILPVCSKLRLDPMKVIPPFTSEKQINSFYQEFPISYTLCRLANGLIRDRSRKIESNDIFDKAAFTFAIPYCDAVVGERYYLTYALQEGLGEIYGTQIFTKIEELIPLLDNWT